LIDVEPVTSQVRVVLSPELMEAGFALKVDMIGAPPTATVMVADAVELPELLVAVRVYLVVVPGETLCCPVGCTGPIVGLMETESAPVTFQDNVAGCPATILSGLKPKPPIIGKTPVTSIFADWSTEPKRLPATSL
jgi:hypothetical protein